MFCLEEAFREELLQDQVLKHPIDEWEASISKPIPSDVRTLIVTGFPIWERDFRLSLALREMGILFPGIESQKYKKYPQINTGTKVIKWRGEKVAIPSEKKIGNIKIFLRYADEYPQKKCFRCGRIGHIGTECQEGTTCFICGEKNHKSNTCPQKKEGEENAWTCVHYNHRAPQAVSRRTWSGTDTTAVETNLEVGSQMTELPENEEFPALQGKSPERDNTNATPYKYTDISPITKNRGERPVAEEPKTPQVVAKVTSTRDNQETVSTSPESTINEAFNRLIVAGKTNTSTPVNERQNIKESVKASSTIEETGQQETCHDIKENEDQKEETMSEATGNENNESDNEEEPEAIPGEAEKINVPEIESKRSNYRGEEEEDEPQEQRELEQKSKKKRDKIKRKRFESSPEEGKPGILERWLKRGKKDNSK